MSSRVKMILDCDPGHDDAMAIVVAANHADLVGVTTVAGNAPITATTRNARIVLDMIGSKAPLHQGARRPLVAEPKDAAYVHGESGLDGADLPEPSRPPIAKTQCNSLLNRAGILKVSGLFQQDHSPTLHSPCAQLQTLRTELRAFH